MMSSFHKNSLGLSENNELLAQKSQGQSENDELLAQNSQSLWLQDQSENV